MQIGSFRYSASQVDGSRSVSINGASAGSGAALLSNAVTSINNVIGRNSSIATPGEYFRGDLGEIIIYNRALKLDERREVEK
jgi:hypothetical protein